MQQPLEIYRGLTFFHHQVRCLARWPTGHRHWGLCPHTHKHALPEKARKYPNAYTFVHNSQFLPTFCATYVAEKIRNRSCLRHGVAKQNAHTHQTMKSSDEHSQAVPVMYHRGASSRRSCEWSSCTVFGDNSLDRELTFRLEILATITLGNTFASICTKNSWETWIMDGCQFLRVVYKFESWNAVRGLWQNGVLHPFLMIQPSTRCIGIRIGEFRNIHPAMETCF